MVWKVISLILLLLGILLLPFWPYPRPWPSEASVFICAFVFFVAVLTFLVSIMARRGSSIWKNRGQG